MKYIIDEREVWLALKKESEMGFIHIDTVKRILRENNNKNNNEIFIKNF